MSDYPCACGHTVEEHAGGPLYQGDTGCTQCGCLAYEADRSEPWKCAKYDAQDDFTKSLDVGYAANPRARGEWRTGVGAKMKDAFDRFQSPDRGRFGDNEQRGAKAPRVTGASDLVDLTLMLKQEKPLAIAVTDPAGAEARWIWLPKSQIEYEKKSEYGAVVVTMPSWLARDKGLI